MNAHHHRQARTIDIGVQQPDACAFCSQCQRQIDGHCALADPPLARGHGHNILDPGQQLHATLHRVRHNVGGNVDRYIGHARHRFGRCHQGRPQGCNLALGRVAQLHVKSHVSLGHGHVLDGFAGYKVAAGIRVDYGGNRVLDRLHCHGHSFTPEDVCSLANPAWAAMPLQNAPRKLG